MTLFFSFSLKTVKTYMLASEASSMCTLCIFFFRIISYTPSYDICRFEVYNASLTASCSTHLTYLSDEAMASIMIMLAKRLSYVDIDCCDACVMIYCVLCVMHDCGRLSSNDTDLCRGLFCLLRSSRVVDFAVHQTS